MRGFTSAALAPLLGTLMSFSADVMELDVTVKGLGRNVANNVDDSITFDSFPAWWNDESNDEKDDKVTGFKSSLKSNPDILNDEDLKDPFKRPIQRFNLVHEHHLLLNNANENKQDDQHNPKLFENEPSEVLAISMETMCSPLMMYDWKMAVFNSNDNASSSTTDRQTRGFSSLGSFGEDTTMGTLTCDVNLVTTTILSEEHLNSEQNMNIDTNSVHFKNSYRGTLELNNVSCNEEIMVIVSAPKMNLRSDYNESSTLLSDDKQSDLQFEHVLTLDQCSFQSKDSDVKHSTQQYISTHSRGIYKARAHDSAKGDDTDETANLYSEQKRTAKTPQMPPHVAIHPAFTSQLPQMWRWKETGRENNDSWNSIQLILPLTYTYPQLDQLRSRVYTLGHKIQMSDLLTMFVGLLTVVVLCFHLAMAKRLLQCGHVSNDKFDQKQIASAPSTFWKTVGFFGTWKTGLHLKIDETVFYFCKTGLHLICAAFEQMSSIGRQALVADDSYTALKEFEGTMRLVFGAGFVCKLWSLFVKPVTLKTKNVFFQKTERMENDVQVDKNLTDSMDQEIMRKIPENLTNNEVSRLPCHVPVPPNSIQGEEDDGHDDDVMFMSEVNVDVAVDNGNSGIISPDSHLKENPIPTEVDVSSGKDNGYSAGIEQMKAEDKFLEKISDPFTPRATKNVTHDIQVGEALMIANEGPSASSIEKVKAIEDVPLERTAKDHSSFKRTTVQHDVRDTKATEEVEKVNEEHHEAFIDPNVRTAPNSFVAEILAKSDKIFKRKVKSPEEVSAAITSPPALTKNPAYGRSSPKRLVHNDDKQTTNITRTNVLSRTKEFEQKCFKSTKSSAPAKGSKFSPKRANVSPKHSSSEVQRSQATAFESDGSSSKSKLHSEGLKKEETNESNANLAPPKEEVPTSGTKGLGASNLVESPFDDGVLHDKRFSFINEYWEK